MNGGFRLNLSFKGWHRNDGFVPKPAVEQAWALASASALEKASPETFALPENQAVAPFLHRAADQDNPTSAASSERVHPNIRGVYNRGNYWDERVKMAQWWSDYLDELRLCQASR